MQFQRELALCCAGVTRVNLVTFRLSTRSTSEHISASFSFVPHHGTAAVKVEASNHVAGVPRHHELPLSVHEGLPGAHPSLVGHPDRLGGEPVPRPVHHVVLVVPPPTAAQPLGRKMRALKGDRLVPKQSWVRTLKMAT